MTFDVQTLSYRAPGHLRQAPRPRHRHGPWLTLADLQAARSAGGARRPRGGCSCSAARRISSSREQVRGRAAAARAAHARHARAAAAAKLALEMGAGALQQTHQMLDLIAAMLDYDPATRLTPQRALAHPFADAFPVRARAPELLRRRAAASGGQWRARQRTGRSRRWRAAEGWRGTEPTGAHAAPRQAWCRARSSASAEQAGPGRARGSIRSGRRCE